MRRKLIIIFSIFTFVILYISLFYPINPLRILKGKENYAHHIISKSGGIEQLRIEAKGLFNEFENDLSPINSIGESYINKFPSIISIGKFATMHKETKKLPKHIAIRYGTRTLTEFIIIFESDEDFSILDKNTLKNYIELGNNIYVTDVILP